MNRRVYDPELQVALARRIRLRPSPDWNVFRDWWTAFNALYNTLHGGSERDRVMRVVEQCVPEAIAARILCEVDPVVRQFAALPPGDMRLPEVHPSFRQQSTDDLSIAQRNGEQSTRRLAHVLAVVYLVRCNLVHGDKDPDVQRDRELVAWSNQVLALTVPSLENAIDRHIAVGDAVSRSDRSMARRWIELVTVTLLFGSVTAAAANDLCFVDDLGLPPLVITNFSLPKAGQCDRFGGSFQDGAFLASGLACGSAQVDNINFKIEIEPPIVGETVSYSFFVNRETLTGEGAILCSPAECDVVFGIPFGSLTFSIRQVACPPKKSSVP